MNGISRLMRTAAWFEQRLGLETHKIFHEGLAAKNSWCLETCGAHLYYVILIDGGFLYLSVQPLDSVDAPERLLTVTDGPDGFER
jgi:hypothetical protein